jgi:hypothetical protein
VYDAARGEEFPLVVPDSITLTGSVVEGIEIVGSGVPALAGTTLATTIFARDATSAAEIAQVSIRTDGDVGIWFQKGYPRLSRSRVVGGPVGVLCEGASPTLRQVQVDSTTSAGVECIKLGLHNSEPVIGGSLAAACDIESPGGDLLVNADPVAVVEARYVFWGHTDCDTFATRIVGPGVIDFTNFLDSLHVCIYPDCDQPCNPITAVEDGHSAPAVLPASLAMGPARPNPFNPRVTVDLALPAAGEVTIRVFDVTGRAVRSLHRGALAGGRFEVTWDGTDDGGRPAASGVYFLRAETPAGVATRRAVLVR